MTAPDRSAYTLLEESVRVRPERPALRVGADVVTYAELGQRVGRLAGWLAEHGVRRGDRVCVHLSKSVEEVVGMFAALRIGAAFVNVNFQWTATQLATILADCTPAALLIDARALRGLTRVPGVALPPAVLWRGALQADLPGNAWGESEQAAACARERSDPDGLAAILYTSGSTGGPKGVMLSHGNLTLGARSVADYLGNHGQDRVLGLLPFSFDYGLSQLTTQFSVGGSVSLLSAMMPAEIVRTLREDRITGLPALPSIWTPLVRFLQRTPESFPELRYLTNTGGKIPDPILAALPEVFPGTDIYLMYGLTEGFRATYLPPHKFARKRGSIGQAIPGAEIFVVDGQAGLCGAGQTGELIQRGGLVFQGYWGSPEATDAVLKPNPHLTPRIGPEKVLHSGDLVRVDEEGDLWFVGRRDGLIKSSGFRVGPTEVEDVLQGVPGVREVVCFGVPDEVLGERVEVAVVAAGDELDVARLREHCRRHLPSYMVPAAFHLWPGELPRTPHGKYDRRRVVRELEPPAALSESSGIE